jgi:hypothetical protein
MAPRKMKMGISKTKVAHPGANLGKFLHAPKKPGKARVKSIARAMSRPKGY